MLDRSPILPTGSLPASLECQFDQDGNGLDDEIERQIAHCLVPEFRFDHQENDNPAGVTALRDDEPNLLFSMYRDGPDRLVIKFVALWRKDGGFVLDDDWWTGWGCGASNAHEGDAQGFSVQAEIVAGSEAWYVAPLGMNAGGNTTVDGLGAARTELTGSHPIIYPTAGKHHFQPHTSYECSPISDPFTCCWDRADGQGVHVIPGQGRGALAHVPAQSEPVMTNTAIEGDPPIWVVTDHLYYNVCKFRKDGIKVPPAGFQGNDLGTVGYPNQTIWEHFYSSVVDVAGPQLAQKVKLDNDEDGRTDTSAFLFGQNGSVTGISLPTDRCPWDTNDEDPDGDALAGACDPDPKFRNRYVAGGSATFPTFHRPPGILSGWLSFHGEQGFTGVAGPRGGFLDTDQDGPVDGEDLCPSKPNGASDLTDANAWAEQNLFGQYADSSDLGRFYRGDQCDPYPSTSTRWLDTGEASSVGNLCSTMSWSNGGTDVVSFRASVGAGLSANTPPPGPVVDLRSFAIQNYRCACAGPANVNCVRDPSSPCYRVTASPALPTTAAGRGWRPVQREGCARDAQGFCVSQTVPNRSSQTVRWEWRNEVTSFPSHFAADDVVAGSPGGLLGLGRTSDVTLQYSYALWTQTLEGASFTTPPGANLNQISMFPEPERTDIGAPLMNVASAESRRLRASFADSRGLRSPFNTFVSFGAACTLPPIFCTSCPERPWDPVSILAPRTVSNPGAVRVFRPGTTLPTAAVLAGDTRTISSVVPTDALHWSSVTPGIGTAVASIGAIATSTVTEPVLLWVETGALASRWAILEPQAMQPNAIQYSATLEGELPLGASSAARLIGDGAGSIFTLFDRTRRTLMAFDPSAVAWIQTPNVPAELFDRTGMTFGLFGSELLATGGTLGGVVRSDGFIINVLTGNVRLRSFGLPARTGGRLFPTIDGGAVLFVGGFDSLGKAHDDVWRIPLEGASALTATRVLSDSSAATSFNPSTVLFGGSTDGRFTAVGQLPTGAFGANARTAAGWEPSECPPRDVTAHALYATDELKVNDGARVLLGSSFASIASTGTLETNLGVAAEVGSILSRPRVFLRDRSVVRGDVLTNADVVRQSGVVVMGTTTQNSGYAGSALSCAVVPFPTASGGAVQLQPDQKRTLLPGSYGNAGVKARAELKLSAGAYYFESLLVDPLGKLSLDTTNGLIRIYVRSGFTFRGLMPSTGGPSRVLFVYTGTAMASVEQALGATIVAPNAKVDLKTVPAPGHAGAVFAKQVEMHQNTSFTQKPFQGSWRP